MNKKLIVLHGVGGSTAGTVASDVARVIGLSNADQRTIWLDGRSFIEIANLDDDRSVLEVNWSDLRKAPATTWGVLRHVLYMLTSMIDVAQSRLGGFAATLVATYRMFLFSGTVGAVAVMLISAAAFTIDNTGTRRLAVILLAGAFLVAAVYLQRFGRQFWWLWAWCAPVLIYSIVGVTRQLAEADTLVPIAIKLRAVWFLGMLVALHACAVASVIRFRRHSLAIQGAYLAFLYIPFLITNALTTWVTLFSMTFLSQFKAYDDLQRLGAMPGLARFERAGTVVFGSVAVLALAAPLVGYLRGAASKTFNSESKVNKHGLGGQNGMSLVLIIAPVALAALGLYTIQIIHEGGQANADIIAVYKQSVLRTLPLLGWLVGPFAVVLTVAGEVLFFLQPNCSHPASIRTECLRRLELAVAYARKTVSSDEVVVLAHSQGSVIAAELRRQGRMDCALITIGSPVSSLYGRFLGVDLCDRQLSSRPWINGYRDGDYIAGPIDWQKVENVHMGPGEHTGYWTDKKLQELLARAHQ